MIYSTLVTYKAENKARLLTGTYTLQANWAQFNQNEVGGTCKLCFKDIDTREHFIATCKGLELCRKNYNIKVATLLKINAQLITPRQGKIPGILLGAPENKRRNLTGQQEHGNEISWSTHVHCGHHWSIQNGHF